MSIRPKRTNSKPWRTTGRRKSDLVPAFTRVLKDVLVVTGAAVSVIYSYGFGQQSNDPLIVNRGELQRAEVIRQARETEERIAEINVHLEEIRRNYCTASVPR